MKIGAQLYTVHKHCQTLDDFSETLKKVRDIGYTSVQVSGTCAYEAEWLKEELDKNDLTCDLTHISYDQLANNTDAVIKNHEIFNCKYIGLGAMPGIFGKDITRKDWEEFSQNAKNIGSKIKNSGKYFMYHNHHFEFFVKDGDYPMNYFVNNIPEECMGFTLDMYWVKAGGHDPIEWLKKLKGRIPCIHLKDMLVMPDGEKRFAPVGSGCLDFEKITETAIALGTEFAFVEQDNSYDEDAFDCLKKSYDYLKSLGLS